MAATYRAPEQIITSLLDTDWYKLTMMQGVHHKYANASVVWEFRCRNAEDLSPYLDDIRAQVDGLRSLSLSAAESDYLGSFAYMSPDFIRFLELYRFCPEYGHAHGRQRPVHRHRRPLDAQYSLRDRDSGDYQRGA